MSIALWLLACNKGAIDQRTSSPESIYIQFVDYSTGNAVPNLNVLLIKSEFGMLMHTDSFITDQNGYVKIKKEDVFFTEVYVKGSKYFDFTYHVPNDRFDQSYSDTRFAERTKTSGKDIYFEVKLYARTEYNVRLKQVNPYSSNLTSGKPALGLEVLGHSDSVTINTDPRISYPALNDLYLPNNQNLDTTIRMYMFTDLFNSLKWKVELKDDNNNKVLGSGFSNTLRVSPGSSREIMIEF